jgi:hypothetical protein
LRSPLFLELSESHGGGASHVGFLGSIILLSLSHGSLACAVV